MDEDVVDPVEMREHGHARLGLDARDQPLAAARHDHVDHALARQHRADRGAIGGGDELDRVGGQPGRRQPATKAAWIARLLCDRFDPPRRITALPDPKHKAAASAVTLGRLS